MPQLTGPPSLQPGRPPAPPVAVRRAWYRRPVLVVPLALVLAAAGAAALFLALRPATITARGGVVDRLTGRPVAGAALRADGRPARTNSRGAFQIPGLPPHARLRIGARYYATARVTATGNPQRVRLAPVPVHVTITSALTGRPLAATLSPAHGPPVRARADGTATLYLTGPGEALTVTTGGYRPGRAVIAQDHTATAALDPTRHTMRRQLSSWLRRGKYGAIVGWVLRPGTGYFLMAGTLQHQRGGLDPMTAYLANGYIDSVNVSVG